MYKSIIIGCGKIAGLYDDAESNFVYSHAHAYHNNPQVETVCYCDRDIARAQKLAHKYGSESFDDDYQRSIKEFQPEIVSVCTPDSTHFQVVKSILDLDKQYLPGVIFLEKPACSNEQELDELVRLSDKRGISIVVNHSRRFDPLHQQLKKQIQTNEFGRLVKACAVYYSGWKHNGVHTVDTLHYLFSDQLKFDKILHASPSPYAGDDNIDFYGRLEQADVPVCIVAMDERYYQLFEFDFMFEHARIRIEDFGNRVSYEVQTVNNMDERVLTPKEFPLHTDRKTSPMQYAVNLIVDHVHQGKSLDGYRIGNIAQTMRAIWEGEAWLRSI